MTEITEGEMITIEEIKGKDLTTEETILDTTVLRSAAIVKLNKILNSWKNYHN